MLTKVLEQEASAGKPPRTAAASAQILAATPGREELIDAEHQAVESGLTSGVLGGSPTQLAGAAAIVEGLRRIRRAGLAWVGLVGTKRRFDFKNETPPP